MHQRFLRQSSLRKVPAMQRLLRVRSDSFGCRPGSIGRVGARRPPRRCRELEPGAGSPARASSPTTGPRSVPRGRTRARPGNYITRGRAARLHGDGLNSPSLKLSAGSRGCTICPSRGSQPCWANARARLYVQGLDSLKTTGRPGNGIPLRRPNPAWQPATGPPWPIGQRLEHRSRDERK